MALGWGSKSRPVEDTTLPIDASPNPEVAYGYDAEKGGEKGEDQKERKMSRVGGVGVIADSDSQLSVGKQLELEATNSIKYRTCSWQKASGSLTRKSHTQSTDIYSPQAGSFVPVATAAP